MSKTAEGQKTTLPLALVASSTVEGLEPGYSPLSLTLDGSLRVSPLAASALPNFSLTVPGLTPAHPTYTDVGPWPIYYPLKGVRFIWMFDGLEFPIVDTVSIVSNGLTIAQWSGAGFVAGSREVVTVYPGIDLTSLPAPDTRNFSLPIVDDFTLRFVWGAGIFNGALISVGGSFIP